MVGSSFGHVGVVFNVGALARLLGKTFVISVARAYCTCWKIASGWVVGDSASASDVVD